MSRYAIQNATGLPHREGRANIRRHAQAMVNDLGEAIKPYLKQLYMAVKHDPRATDLRKSMDKEDHDDEHDVTG